MKRSFGNTLFTYTVIILVACVAYGVRWISGIFDSRVNTALFFISLAVISTIWESLRYLHSRLNIWLPFEQNVPLRIAVQLVAGAVIAVTVRFAIYKFGEPFLPIRLDTLFLATTWAIFIFAVAGLNSVFFVSFFIGRWKDSLVRAERLEKEKTQIQFDNLRNQLNPHFLFNALTSLNSLITEDPALASQFLQHMSKVYRYVLQNKDKNFVSLQTELDFIRNYVFLMETRFGGALKINLNIGDATLENAIVPVTLQVLIENAIKHNIIDPGKPLLIDLFSSDVYLIVSNNLQKRKTVESSNKQGLDNLKSLYRFLTDRPLLIEERETQFIVKVPLL